MERRGLLRTKQPKLPHNLSSPSWSLFDGVLRPMLFRQLEEKPPEKSNGAVAGRHCQTVEQQAESEKCGMYGEG
jgi:hypothetical protein